MDYKWLVSWLSTWIISMGYKWMVLLDISRAWLSSNSGRTRSKVREAPGKTTMIAIVKIGIKTGQNQETLGSVNVARENHQL